MIDYTTYNTELDLAKTKSGLTEGNATASTKSIEHLINTVEQLGNMVKQLEQTIESLKQP
jgi:hypothetical protein